MTIVLLHGLWTPVTVLLFVLFARPDRNPFALVGRALRLALTTPSGRLVLAVAVGVSAANSLECLLEDDLARWLGYDLTAMVRALEGDAVERVQATLPGALVGPATWFYLSAYIALLATPVLVWGAEGNRRPLRGWLAAFVANYVFALPFYLFVPVQEVAWSGLSDALPLLDAVWPGLSGETRVGSGLDNCFPSLHVSCTVTVLVFCHRHGPRGLRILAWVVALGTAYTVVALGIHWVLDVVAGVPFGLLCAAVGARWAARSG